MCRSGALVLNMRENKTTLCEQEGGGDLCMRCEYLVLSRKVLLLTCNWFLRCFLLDVQSGTCNCGTSRACALKSIMSGSI